MKDDRLLNWVANVLSEQPTSVVTATARAPSNIALAKYWGKRDAALNLPQNSSLSISLADWGTTTHVQASQTGADQVRLNGTLLDAADPFVRKVVTFADLFRRGVDLPLEIETVNTIPTAAGLASSASGFAALTRALAGAFGYDLPERALSQLARIGSGSASRSLWHGFVRWDKGQRSDGSDCFGRSLDVTWPEFRIAILEVDTGPKDKTSRDGMNHTVDTSPLYRVWPEQAEADCAQIEAAVRQRDLARTGALAEANALAMHATMMAARPALVYLKAASWACLDQLWTARAAGLNAYATMDAGPNIKLIFEAQDEADVRALFPSANVIAPFGAVAAA